MPLLVSVRIVDPINKVANSFLAIHLIYMYSFSERTAIILKDSEIKDAYILVKKRNLKEKHCRTVEKESFRAKIVE